MYSLKYFQQSCNMHVKDAPLLRLPLCIEEGEVKRHSKSIQSLKLLLQKQGYAFVQLTGGEVLLRHARLDLVKRMADYHHWLDVHSDPKVFQQVRSERENVNGVGKVDFMPISCLKLQVQPTIISIFEYLLYPNQTGSIVSKLDVPQLVPPGQFQSYIGYPVDQYPICGLLTLTDQLVTNDRMRVPEGTLILYNREEINDQFFRQNPSFGVTPWIGLRISFFRQDQDPLQQQRSHLFYGGHLGVHYARSGCIVERLIQKEMRLFAKQNKRDMKFFATGSYPDDLNIPIPAIVQRQLTDGKLNTGVKPSVTTHPLRKRQYENAKSDEREKEQRNNDVDTLFAHDQKKKSSLQLCRKKSQEEGTCSTGNPNNSTLHAAQHRHIVAATKSIQQDQATTHKAPSSTAQSLTSTKPGRQLQYQEEEEVSADKRQLASSSTPIAQSSTSTMPGRLHQYQKLGKRQHQNSVNNYKRDGENNPIKIRRDESNTKTGNCKSLKPTTGGRKSMYLDRLKLAKPRQPKTVQRVKTTVQTPDLLSNILENMDSMISPEWSNITCSNNKENMNPNPQMNDILKEMAQFPSEPISPLREEVDSALTQADFPTVSGIQIEAERQFVSMNERGDVHLTKSPTYQLQTIETEYKRKPSVSSLPADDPRKYMLATSERTANAKAEEKADKKFGREHRERVDTFVDTTGHADVEDTDSDLKTKDETLAWMKIVDVLSSLSCNSVSNVETGVTSTTQDTNTSPSNAMPSSSLTQNTSGTDNQSTALIAKQMVDQLYKEDKQSSRKKHSTSTPNTHLATQTLDSIQELPVSEKTSEIPLPFKIGSIRMFERRNNALYAKRYGLSNKIIVSEQGSLNSQRCFVKGKSHAEIHEIRGAYKLYDVLRGYAVGYSVSFGDETRMHKPPREKYIFRHDIATEELIADEKQFNSLPVQPNKVYTIVKEPQNAYILSKEDHLWYNPYEKSLLLGNRSRLNLMFDKMDKIREKSYDLQSKEHVDKLNNLCDAFHVKTCNSSNEWDDKGDGFYILGAVNKSVCESLQAQMDELCIQRGLDITVRTYDLSNKNLYGERGLMLLFQNAIWHVHNTIETAENQGSKVITFSNDHLANLFAALYLMKFNKKIGPQAFVQYIDQRGMSEKDVLIKLALCSPRDFLEMVWNILTVDSCK